MDRSVHCKVCNPCQTAVRGPWEEAAAAAYFRLLEYHEKCAAEVEALASPSSEVFSNSEFTWWSANCARPMRPSGWAPTASSDRHPAWGAAFMDKIKTMAKRPSRTIVTGGELLVQMVRLTSQCCIKCKEADSGRICALLEKLGENVNKVISKVTAYILVVSPACVNPD